MGNKRVVQSSDNAMSYRQSVANIFVWLRSQFIAVLHMALLSTCVITMHHICKAILYNATVFNTSFWRSKKINLGLKMIRFPQPEYVSMHASPLFHHCLNAKYSVRYVRSLLMFFALHIQWLKAEPVPATFQDDTKCYAPVFCHLLKHQTVTEGLLCGLWSHKLILDNSN